MDCRLGKGARGGGAAMEFEAFSVGRNEGALAEHPPVTDPNRLDYERGLGIPLIRILTDEVEFKPSPTAFTTSQDKRRWLDFITWYHQAIIDFTEQSVRALLKYYPAEKIRTKPGGSAGGAAGGAGVQ